jgi:predicted GNAT family N-acyltransferase
MVVFTMTLKVSKLDKKTHDRKGFDCGSDELNKFLQSQASQASNRELSRTQVLTDSENPSKVIGYHTLVYSEASHIPSESKLYSPSNRNLPALTIARIAVDNQYKGKRLGEQLLLDCISKAAIAYDVAAPVIGLFVDAKNEEVKAFYLKYGFVVVNGEADPLYLWLPIGTCLKVAEAMT